MPQLPDTGASSEVPKISSVEDLLEATRTAGQSLAAQEDDVAGEGASAAPLSAESEERIRASAETAAAGLTDEEFDQLVEKARFIQPYEGNQLNEDDLQNLLVHCARLGASDINLMTDMPVVAQIASLMVPVTIRPLHDNELRTAMHMLYGSNALSQLLTGEDLDGAFSIRMNKERFRFRYNITACEVSAASTAHITLRTIRAKPMRMSEMRVEPEIQNNFLHDDGLVLICGPTGSGKSSLLAGMMTEVLEKRQSHRKILTYERPIEYTYESIKPHTAMIVQTEIGRNLRAIPDGINGEPGMSGFTRAVRNSLRRSPSIILVGESRDRETIEASLEASETGHALFTTVHGNDSVSEVFYRIINFFPPEERVNKLYEVVRALRLIVIQRLERSVTGTRVPLREFLVFTPKVRNALATLSTLQEATLRIDDLVQSDGQSMAKSAQLRYDEGLLPEATLQKYLLRAREHDNLKSTTSS